MNQSKKLESGKIGALWKRKTKDGMEFLGGEVNGERVVVFPVRKKWQKNSPDYQVLKSSSTPTDENQGGKENDKNSDKEEGKDTNKSEPKAAAKEKEVPF